MGAYGLLGMQLASVRKLRRTKNAEKMEVIITNPQKILCKKVGLLCKGDGRKAMKNKFKKLNMMDIALRGVPKKGDLRFLNLLSLRFDFIALCDISHNLRCSVTIAVSIMPLIAKREVGEN